MMTAVVKGIGGVDDGGGTAELCIKLYCQLGPPSPSYKNLQTKIV